MPAHFSAANRIFAAHGSECAVLSFHIATDRAIRRALRQAHAAGKAPEAVLLSIELRASLRATPLLHLWSGHASDLLFGGPVEVDATAQDWTLGFRD